MNRYRSCCFFILLSASFTSFAEEIDKNGTYWECTTHDAANTVWSSQSLYQKIALNLAYAQCKKNSKAPITCKTSKTQCAKFVGGVNVLPIWRCTALDREAIAWRSNLYQNREDAGLAALAHCRQKSPVPYTCYINLITCININEL